MDYHIFFWNFIPVSKNKDYYMQFLKILSFLQKLRLSYAIYEISFFSQKTWSIICNFWNSFLFCINVDYHIQCLEFHSLLQKRGLSYGISGISFPSPKTGT